MNTSELTKKSKTAKEIFEEIKSINENNPNHFKFFIPHFVYVSNDTVSDLLRMGFKAYYGDWFHGEKGLIIEW